MSNETISLGSCKTCGAPAQFLDDGTTRHVDVKQDEIDRLRARVRVVSDAYSELKATVEGECPSLINEDSGASQNLASLMNAADNTLANSEKED